MGRPTAHPTPLVAYALHDDDTDVVGGDIVEAVAELEPTLPLGCRWRVPLTQLFH